MRGGAQFSKVIEEALEVAEAVVVLWSKKSVESPWVRDEAAAGRDSDRLSYFSRWDFSRRWASVNSRPST